MDANTPTLGELDRRLTDHTSRLNDHGKRIGNIETGQSEMRSEIREARSDHADLKGEIRSFKAWFIGLSIPLMGIGLTIIRLLAGSN